MFRSLIPVVVAGGLFFLVLALAVQLSTGYHCSESYNQSCQPYYSADSGASQESSDPGENTPDKSGIDPFSTEGIRTWLAMRNYFETDEGSRLKEAVPEGRLGPKSLAASNRRMLFDAAIDDVEKRFGLTVNQYNAVAAAYNSNPDFRERVDKIHALLGERARWR